MDVRRDPRLEAVVRSPVGIRRLLIRPDHAGLGSIRTIPARRSVLTRGQSVHHVQSAVARLRVVHDERIPELGEPIAQPHRHDKHPHLDCLNPEDR